MGVIEEKYKKEKEKKCKVQGAWGSSIVLFHNAIQRYVYIRQKA